MNNNLIGVYGASGFGSEVIHSVNSISSSGDAIVFIDDNPKCDIINGYNVLTFIQFINMKHKNKFATIAIADCKIRKKIASKLAQYKIKILDVKSPNVIVMDNVNIQKGYILSPFVTITSNVEIKEYFHANLYSYVAHDCKIGSYVTFAPSVKCNGNVHIEDFAYIGTGAIIKQGTPEKPIVIGSGAVVGMGSVVTKSVKPGDVVFGNPAKSLKRAR